MKDVNTKKRGRVSFLKELKVEDCEMDIFGNKYLAGGEKFISLQKVREHFGKVKIVRISNKPKNKKIKKDNLTQIVDNDSSEWELGKIIKVGSGKVICIKDNNGQFRYVPYVEENIKSTRKVEMLEVVEDEGLTW